MIRRTLGRCGNFVFSFSGLVCGDAEFEDRGVNSTVAYDQNEKPDSSLSKAFKQMETESFQRRYKEMEDLVIKKQRVSNVFYTCKWHQSCVLYF